MNGHSTFPAGLLAMATAVVLAACTTAPAGQSRFDESVDFTTYRSFAFLTQDVLVVSSPNPVNPALEPTLVEETRSYLTRRGYQFVDDPARADFVIAFTVGGAPTVRTTAFGDNYNQVRIIGEGVDDEIVTQESTEAGLMIDFYDPAGRKKWMGWAREEITYSDQVRLRSTVRDIVAVILRNFPPEPGSASQPG